MAKRNRRQVVEERWNVKEERGKVINAKFEQARIAPPLQPKSEAQRYYIDALMQDKIVIGSGSAGSGKSYCASYKAAQLLQCGEIDKIYITRPYAHLGKDYGATPGDDAEKLTPFCRPMLDTLKKVLGEGKYNYCLEKGDIEIAPLEKIQGRSFDEPCVIIADECQNATKPQMLSLVTRLGEEVRYLAILGDPRQSIERGENALDWITNFFDRHEIQGVSIIEFTEEDCVRSGIVRDILVAFEKDGGFYNQL